METLRGEFLTVPVLVCAQCRCLSLTDSSNVDIRWLAGPIDLWRTLESAQCIDEPIVGGNGAMIYNA